MTTTPSPSGRLECDQNGPLVPSNRPTRGRFPCCRARGKAVRCSGSYGTYKCKNQGSQVASKRKRGKKRLRRQKKACMKTRINGPVEGVSSHGQERAYEQNPGGPSRAAQQQLLRDLLSSDRKQSHQHGGKQRLL